MSITHYPWLRDLTDMLGRDRDIESCHIITRSCVDSTGIEIEIITKKNKYKVVIPGSEIKNLGLSLVGLNSSIINIMKDSRRVWLEKRDAIRHQRSKRYGRKTRGLLRTMYL